MPYTQPRTTYIVGNKITPAWGLTHRGDMDPAKNWSVPRYSPPKLTGKQETARKEAHKEKKKYKRYKPGQLALKEIKYYQKKPGFIIPISAIRRLCLEIGYEFKQVHGPFKSICRSGANLEKTSRIRGGAMQVYHHNQ